MFKAEDGPSKCEQNKRKNKREKNKKKDELQKKNLKRKCCTEEDQSSGKKQKPGIFLMVSLGNLLNISTEKVPSS